MKRGSHTSRREFLRLSTAALAGAALSSPGARAKASESPQNPEDFVYRTLGRTGLRVPVVGMGSCYAINMIRAALEQGLVYLHTSAGYANHEQLLGQAVKGVKRDSFIVGTSPDLPYKRARGGGPTLDIGREVDPKLIIKSCENSLKLLKLDHIDIFWLGSIATRDTTMHWPYIDAFLKLKTDGKIRFAGVGTHASEPRVIRAAVETGFWDVVLTAHNFRQKHRSQVRFAIKKAADAGLGVIAMKTQAGVYWDPGRRRMINMKAALKWVLQDENVHTSIPAFANYGEMMEDISVMADLEFTPEERKDLGLGEDLGFSGHYCQQCGECLPQCPAGVDVPTLMRGYMYAFGHRQPKMARHALRSWRASDISCVNCGECAVDCASGFDVKSRAGDMARLLEVPEEFLG